MVPGGTNVPLVAQVGKWRAQAMVDTSSCTTQNVTLAFPKDPQSGDGPVIAVATGGGDMLECTLDRMGIFPFVKVYQGTGGANTNPAAPVASTSLWSSNADLAGTDIVLLSCEAQATVGAAPQVISSYLNAGGSVWAEHWGYVWFNGTAGIATWATGANIQGTSGAISAQFPGTPPAVAAMSQWVGAQTGATGLSLMNAAANVTAVTSPTIDWLNAASTAPTPNVPTLISWTGSGGLGKAVYSDFHVGSASGDYGLQPGSLAVPANAIVPSGCANKALTPAEVAFAYMFFTQLSCSP
jgi:hypothetical protein